MKPLLGEIVQREIAVAAEAIEAVKLKMLFKSGQTEETLEGGLFHLHHIAEAHVIGDERADLMRLVIGEVKAAADFLCHARSHLGMMVKANAIRRNTKCGRLADVVKQGATRQ